MSRYDEAKKRNLLNQQSLILKEKADKHKRQSDERNFHQKVEDRRQREASEREKNQTRKQIAELQERKKDERELSKIESERAMQEQKNITSLEIARLELQKSLGLEKVRQDHEKSMEFNKYRHQKTLQREQNWHDKAKQIRQIEHEQTMQVNSLRHEQWENRENRRHELEMLFNKGIEERKTIETKTDNAIREYKAKTRCDMEKRAGEALCKDFENMSAAKWEVWKTEQQAKILGSTQEEIEEIIKNNKDDFDK